MSTPSGLDSSADMDDHEAPTEEEQLLYEKFVVNGIRILSNPQVVAAILERMRNEDPIQVVAESTYMLVERILSDARSRGMHIPGEIAMQGGMEIMGELISLAESVGVARFTDQQREMAFYKALDIAGTHMARLQRFDPKQVQEDYNQLGEMARSGRLDRAMGRKPAPDREGPGNNPDAGMPNRGQPQPPPEDRQALLSNWESKIKPQMVAEIRQRL
ncbi:MAG: hypothetical protein HQL65_05865 [Magnetococcales bacterium]|nr:hypothetical protein [Magnetococcales bacterium]